MLPRIRVTSLTPPFGTTPRTDRTNRIVNAVAAIAASNDTGDTEFGNNLTLKSLHYSEPRWSVSSNGGTGSTSDANLGAVAISNSFGNYHFASNLASNPLNVIWHTGTMACIVRQKTVAFETGFLRSGTSAYGSSLGISAGSLQFIKNGSGTPTNITSSISMVTGAPYFIAVSWDDTIGVIFVVRRLDTGQLYYEVDADVTNITVTSDGNCIAETNGSNNLLVAGLAFNTINLSLAELLNWAGDPWSFWYPKSRLPIVGKTAVTQQFMFSGQTSNLYRPVQIEGY